MSTLFLHITKLRIKLIENVFRFTKVSSNSTALWCQLEKRLRFCNIWLSDCLQTVTLRGSNFVMNNFLQFKNK